jgi:hypothetical protein
MIAIYVDKLSSLLSLNLDVQFTVNLDVQFTGSIYWFNLLSNLLHQFTAIY